MKRILISMVLLAASALPVLSQAVFTQTWTENADLTDGDLSGGIFTADVSTLVVSITGVEVTLNIDSSWPGDLYAYLEYDGVHAVLLNRVGRSASNPAGTGPAGGLSITLSDSAGSDIHSATPGGSGWIEGVWQPDARTVDPTAVTDTSPRSAFLSGFNGLNPNGRWTLFVADVDSGEEASLTSWGLRITGVVPEPAPAVLTAVAGVAVACRRRRARGTERV